MRHSVKTVVVVSSLLLGTALAGGAGAQSAGNGVPSTNVNTPAPNTGQSTAQNTNTASPLPYNRATTLPAAGTEDLKKSVQALQNTLTELQALQLQTKQAHWNVSGTLWYTLHELLQDHYEGISKFADDVAEGERCCAAADLAALRRLAHSLKSVLQLLGDDTASELARRIERQAAAGAHDSVAQWPALRAVLQGWMTR